MQLPFPHSRYIMKIGSRHGSPVAFFRKHPFSTGGHFMEVKKYKCTVCGWVYDPATGDPDNDIAPNTPFEEIPDDWTCPECGVTKEDFEPVEE
jgi:rubredoxin